MKWIYYFSILTLITLVSCNEKPPISGKIKLSADNEWMPTIFFIQPRSLDEVAASYTGTILDSAKINTDGSFAFKNIPPSPEPILIELAVHKKGERFFNRLNNDNPAISNYFPIIWKSGDQIEITASISEFQNSLSIKKPTPVNAEIIKLRDIRSAAFKNYLQKNNPEGHDPEQLISEEKTTLNFQQPLMEFAEKTDHFLPAMLATRWVSPENDFERVPEFIFSQCQKWQNKKADHPWTNQLCSKSDREKLPVLKGDKLPDYSLPMLSGDTEQLYQLIGDRLTIVDLWASWCAPCRKENRNYLVPLWDKYHEQGFQIIGYALDGNEKAWRKAIEKDGASRWPHASHLQGDDAPFMQALRIQTIPANFLLDGEGKVIAKNLHGEELIEFVEEYMLE